MNLLNDYINGNGEAVLSDLLIKGFSAEQAKAFLPDAMNSLTEGLQVNDVSSLINTDASTQIATLMPDIDISQLATKFGGSEAQASEGLQVLIPKVMNFLKGNEQMVAALSMLGTPKAGMLGSLKNKLFQ